MYIYIYIFIYIYVYSIYSIYIYICMKHIGCEGMAPGSRAKEARRKRGAESQALRRAGLDRDRGDAQSRRRARPVPEIHRE